VLSVYLKRVNPIRKTYGKRRMMMSKIELIRQEMMKALKERDTKRKDALSLLLSALKAKNIDKRADLTEEEENAIIFKDKRSAGND